MNKVYYEIKIKINFRRKHEQVELLFRGVLDVRPSGGRQCGVLEIVVCARPKRPHSADWVIAFHCEEWHHSVINPVKSGVPYCVLYCTSTVVVCIGY